MSFMHHPPLGLVVGIDFYLVATRQHLLGDVAHRNLHHDGKVILNVLRGLQYHIGILVICRKEGCQVLEQHLDFGR